MASFVQLYPDTASQLGQVIGNAFQQSAQEAQNFQLNKSRLAEAFKSLKSNPMFSQLAEVAPSLLSTAGGSQALAEIAPILLQQALNSNIPTPGADGSFSEIGNNEYRPASKQMNLKQVLQMAAQAANVNSPENNMNVRNVGNQIGSKINQQIKPFKNEPSPFNLDFGVSENFQGRIGPKEEANAIKDMKRKGATIAQIQEFRTAVDRFNNGLIQSDELNDAYLQRKTSRIDKALDLGDKVRNYINMTRPDITEPGDVDLAYSMMQDEIKNQETPDLTRAWSRIEKPFNDIIEEKNSFISQIPDFESDTLGFGISENQQKVLSDSAQSLIRKSPIMRNILSKSMLAKGNNIYDVDKVLSKVQPKMHEVLDESIDFMKSMGKKPIGEIRSDQEKYIPILAKKLSKYWNENSSPVEVIKNLKKRGYLQPVISELFRFLDDEGKLTDQQKTDRNIALDSPLLLKDWF
jgi:hypothetical protein